MAQVHIIHLFLQEVSYGLIYRSYKTWSKQCVPFDYFLHLFYLLLLRLILYIDQKTLKFFLFIFFFHQFFGASGKHVPRPFKTIQVCIILSCYLPPNSLFFHTMYV